MKKTLSAIIGALAVFTVVGCAEPQSVVGDSGRLQVVATKGEVDLEDHGYTILEDIETGCTVLIVEDYYDDGMSVTTLKCEEK